MNGIKKKSNCSPVLGAATIHEYKQEVRIHLGKETSWGGFTEPVKGAVQLRTRKFGGEKKDLGGERNKDVYLCNTRETRERRTTERYR